MHCCCAWTWDPLCTRDSHDPAFSFRGNRITGHTVATKAWSHTGSALRSTVLHVLPSGPNCVTSPIRVPQALDERRESGPVVTHLVGHAQKRELVQPPAHGVLPERRLRDAVKRVCVVALQGILSANRLPQPFGSPDHLRQQALG